LSEPPEKPSALDERAARALASDRIIDITTTGRRSGQPRRIEIWFHNLGGRIYISGLPGQRDWYANLVADPEFVFHLKETAQIDLPARARIVTDPPERRRVLHELLAGIGRDAEVESWAASSPIVEVQFR
jgi:deazaflavin-dependent oxidoreductase (nitroreductase family)